MANLSTIIDYGVSAFGQPEKPVIVTGFWRSGTTFLQDLLTQAYHAKPVFEPLHISSRRYEEFIRNVLPRDTDPKPFANFFMPFPEADDAEIKPLTELLDGTLSGRFSTKWTCHTRNNLARRMGYGELRRIYTKAKISLRRRLVVKFVRAHLLIPWMHYRYEFPIIHIRRDPRSVALSFEKANWTYPGGIDDIDIDALLNAPNDGRRESFGDYAKLIKGKSQAGSIERFSLYWGLCEKFVETYKDFCHIIRYEDLVHDPRRIIKPILQGRVASEAFDELPLQAEVASATTRSMNEKTANHSDYRRQANAALPAGQNAKMAGTLKEIGISLDGDSYRITPLAVRTID